MSAKTVLRILVLLALSALLVPATGISGYGTDAASPTFSISGADYHISGDTGEGIFGITCTGDFTTLTNCVTLCVYHDGSPVLTLTGQSLTRDTETYFYIDLQKGTEYEITATIPGGWTDETAYTTLGSIDLSDTDVYVGESETVPRTLSPDNASDKKMIWTSSDTKIATISDTGSVNGISKGTVTITAVSDEDPSITDTCTVTVAERIIYSITAIAGVGGNISPAGTTYVASGDTQTYTVLPSPTYMVSDVLVDGRSVGAVTTYTFSNVCSDHTIFATFCGPFTVYDIDATAGPGGSISPSGKVSVLSGGTQKFTMNANLGMRVDRLVVDGNDVPSSDDGTYTFTDVRSDHTISVSFRVVGTFEITATAGRGGSISPSGSFFVLVGGSATFTVSADPGYEVDTVMVDGYETSLSEDGTFTFSNVISDHSISVTFTKVSGPFPYLFLLLISIIALITISFYLLIRRRKKEEYED